jgi:hypothetical protein
MILRTLKRSALPSVLTAVALLSIPVRSAPTKLREETLAAWNDYVSWVRLRTEMRVKQSPFLWISELPPRRAEVRSGHIPVWRQGTEHPTNVPYGLIHDWLGAIFIPKATISEVLAVIRDYDRQKPLDQSVESLKRNRMETSPHDAWPKLLSPRRAS